jgi:hypothetical protein
MELLGRKTEEKCHQGKAWDEIAGRKDAEEKCPKKKNAEDEAAGREMAEDQAAGRKEAEEKCPKIKNAEDEAAGRDMAWEGHGRGPSHWEENG